MITAKEAREIANEMAQKQDWYAPINAGRMGMKRKYYQVNDNVCFEYWDKHEWEFTIGIPMYEEKGKAYYEAICAMGAYMHTINVSLSKLPTLLAQCRAKLTSIDKSFEKKVVA